MSTADHRQLGYTVLDLVHSIEPQQLREPLDGHVVATARTVAAQIFARAAQGDADGQLAPESLVALHESGLALAPFPRHHGGLGLIDVGRERDLTAVLRQLGAGDLAVARLFEGHVNAVALVRRYGTDEQLASLADTVRGGALSAVWNAEGAAPLSAQLSMNAWHLTGAKILASGAGLKIRPLITPGTDHGPIMLMPDVIAPERADLSRWTPLGMRASATGTVEFDGMIVPDAQRVGEAGDYLRQPHFSGGAWRFCAVHLGSAERLLDLFRTHLRQRGREGDPYQKQRIAVATTACLTARFWIERAAAIVGYEHEAAEAVVGFVNLTRGVTERACLDVLEAVQRGVGLGAFLRPEPIERIARDLATYIRQPVPDAAMADGAAFVLGSEKPAFDLWELESGC